VTKPFLVVRADASTSVGAGHVMRCLTLTEQWLELGGRAECWGKVDLRFARRRADALGVPIVARPTEEGSVLLVDVYDESERLSLAGANLAKRCVLVDDLGSDVPIGYDAVWNPNAYGRADLYRAFGGEVIAGVDCVPIRRGLPRWVPKGAGAVSCGGGEVPPPLRAALSQLPVALEMPHGWSVGAFTPPGWRLADQDDTWSDLQHAAWLITAAGSTVWEAAAVGIPVAVVVCTENQALVGEWAIKKGAPVIDVRNRTDTSDIVTELVRKVSEVRPLPRLKSGAGEVARRLLQLQA
jgi:spore coat polysaccharide biosynthesis predicted glycosyltransferase SpsG